ncbi:unnamed protein product [Sphenostylis stenocarpa]|uniref:Uncharacterized protein n=1 Tax=Sphenostylis stenocarpa TaxID=92480 RepID=A0AA87B7W5_9FABA|nr:unnamed protein product [Sphenostylis stenocarpa]
MQKQNGKGQLIYDRLDWKHAYISYRFSFNGEILVSRFSNCGRRWKKMEEYLQCMKTLRSQMNDVEDEAAKISVEEEMQFTNVRTLENDIDSAKSGITQLKEDTEKMRAAKGEICSKILEKQKRIATLESDTIKLSQTLELIQQERVGLSFKLSEKRAYYNKVAEDMNAKLQKQQEWVSSTQKISRELKKHDLVTGKVAGQISKAEGKTGAINLVGDNVGSVTRRNLITELDSAKARLDEILTLKANVLTEINKVVKYKLLKLTVVKFNEVKLAFEDVKCRENEFKPELKAAGITALEEEYKAILSDKAGETEYLQSLEKQVEKLKEIRHVLKCACGEEYTIAVNTAAVHQFGKKLTEWFLDL